MTADSPPIRTLGLTTGYTSRRGGEAAVTTGLDASLPAGSLTCLLGPNGAGKSTLLKTMSGQLKPLRGDILLYGTSVSSLSRQQLALSLSLVLTERPRLNHMTVRQLTALGRSPYTGFWGRLSPSDLTAVDTAMQTAGITHLADRTVSSLSDGERQKAMVAKALAQDTPLILLDEPTAFLDYPAKIELMRLLARLARNEGKTVFLSTHDVEIALQTADNLWLLHKSLGLMTGTPDRLGRDGSIGLCFQAPGLSYDPASRRFSLH